MEASVIDGIGFNGKKSKDDNAVVRTKNVRKSLIKRLWTDEETKIIKKVFKKSFERPFNLPSLKDVQDVLHVNPYLEGRTREGVKTHIHHIVKKLKAIHARINTE